MANLNVLTSAACTHLSILGAPTSTPSDIAAANVALESLTGSLDHVSALQLAQHLLMPVFTPSSPNPSLNIIHYAFHILDVHLLNSVKPWTEFPDEVRSALRTLATNAISQLNDQHPSLLFQKAVSLIVALALREWPQRWPDFLDQLLSPSNPPVIVCHVLEDLSEQVHVFSDRIENARRQELRHAMVLTLPQILDYVTKSIQIAHDLRNSAALSAALSCLQSIIPWADLRALFKAAAPNACLALLSNPEFRDSALEALEAFVIRQFQPNEPVVDNDNDPFATNDGNQSSCPFREVIFPGVLQFAASSPGVLAFAPFALIPPSGAFPALNAAAANSTNPDSITQDDHDFAVRFMSVLGLLGATHFLTCFIAPRNGSPNTLPDAQLACACAFVDLIACAFSSPSSRLRLSVLRFFSSLVSGLIKLEDAQREAKKQIVSYSVTAMVQSTSGAALRLWHNAPSVAYGELDDGEEQLSSQREQIGSRLANLLPSLARLDPIYTARLSMERLSLILTLAPPYKEDESSPRRDFDHQDENSTPGPRQIGVIRADGTQHGWTFGSLQSSPTRDWRACVEAACFFVDGISSGILGGSSDIALRCMIAAMKQTFQTVVTKSDALFLPVKSCILRVHHALYLHDEPSLTLCVETFLKMAVSCTNEKHKIRQKVLIALSSVLRKLGNTHVKSISKFHQPLCQYVNAAIGNPSLLTIEKISLLEAAIASVMEVQDLAEQSAGMERILNPLLDILLSDEIRKTISSSENLLTVLKHGPARIVVLLSETILLIEAGVHQIVRPITKSTAPVDRPSPLSRAVAPRALEIGCMLVSTLHGLDGKADKVYENREDVESILQPSCRELAFLLNLDSVESFPKNGKDLTEYIADHSGPAPKRSEGEVRAAKTLIANGVSPPDERYGWVREKLRDLRRGGYEIVRAAIFSGAAQSNQYIQAIIFACCSDANRIEPYHIISILGRVVAPLLSFKICIAGSEFLRAVGDSGIAPFLTAVRELVIRSQRETEIFSSSGAMDIAREHGRRMVARSAAEMLSSMYPRVDTSDGKVEHGTYIPPAFSYGRLAEEIILLWISISDAGGAILEYGAARISFQTLAHAVNLFDIAGFPIYRRLIPAALHTAVHCVRADADVSVLNASISALLSIIRKWGEESEKILLLSIAPDRRNDVAQVVSDCVQKVNTMDTTTIKVRKHRASIRAMIDRIASVEGPVNQKKQTVHALPEKLSKMTAAKSKRRRRKDVEDVELTDSALDSLYGEGDPL